MKRWLSWFGKYRLFFLLPAIFLVNYVVVTFFKGAVRYSIYLSILEIIFIVVIFNWYIVHDFLTKYKRWIYVVCILLSLTGSYVVYLNASSSHINKSLVDYWHNFSAVYLKAGYTPARSQSINEDFHQFITKQPSYSDYINKIDELNKKILQLGIKQDNLLKQLKELKKEPQKNLTQIKKIESELNDVNELKDDVHFYVTVITFYFEENKWKIILTPNWDKLNAAIHSGEFYASIFSTLLAMILNIILIVITLNANRKLTLEMQKMTNESNDKLQQTTALTPMIQEKTQLYARLTEKLILIRKQCLTPQFKPALEIDEVKEDIDYHFLVADKVATLIQEFIQLARIEQPSGNYQSQLDAKLKEIRKEMMIDLKQI
ncbi:hypothetical protein [Laceyella putida]|uniref:Uncharacterized protein n=1 Tax=Laceyella putida TaxID=110101 RepID=A0ABW2RRC9_9BACL